MSAARRLGSAPDGGAPRIDRSPDSGVRLRVRPEDDRSSLAALEAPVTARLSYGDGELALEDAVPFSGNTAITAVFAFAATAAGLLVAAGFYL